MIRVPFAEPIGKILRQELSPQVRVGSSLSYTRSRYFFKVISMIKNALFSLSSFLFSI